MKKEILPEAYTYNKYPGPSFARVGDKVVAEGIELDLLHDHKSAFDQTVFGQRFSPILLKFDYIVGDWGNEQLRLKGFYTNDKVVKTDQKIARLDDYLTEFCNFGCAYFVLGNPFPQEMEEEIEEKPRRKRKRHKKRRPDEQGVYGERRQGWGKQAGKTGKSSSAKPFTIKEERKSSRTTTNSHKRQAAEGVRSFVIRQK